MAVKSLVMMMLVRLMLVIQILDADCDDYNACTDDSCDSSSGCLYTVVD